MFTKPTVIITHRKPRCSAMEAATGGPLARRQRRVNYAGRYCRQVSVDSVRVYCVDSSLNHSWNKFLSKDYQSTMKQQQQLLSGHNSFKKEKTNTAIQIPDKSKLSDKIGFMGFS